MGLVRRQQGAVMTSAHCQGNEWRPSEELPGILVKLHIRSVVNNRRVMHITQCIFDFKLGGDSTDILTTRYRARETEVCKGMAQEALTISCRERRKPFWNVRGTAGGAATGSMSTTRSYSCLCLLHVLRLSQWSLKGKG